jgi:ABC-type lipoprotein export system ATPase subunit
VSMEVIGGAAADATATKKNQHVVDAIRAYCEFRYPQQHALMVNGKWGSGKTHLLEEVREGLIDRRLSGDSNKPLYITLYGVKDATEIGEQIYQQMHPFLSHKGTRFVSALMRGILKTTVKIDLTELHKGDLSLGSQLPEVKVSQLLGGAGQRVIIFDDFERAIMSPVELLGYINPFVEHDGCKVIILANEEVIKDPDGTYKERKEKTVGQTLQVTADVRTAFSAFMIEIDTLELCTCYESHKSEIVAVFDDSGLDNLRLLKQFLWDFERLWGLLTNDQRKHN